MFSKHWTLSSATFESFQSINEISRAHPAQDGPSLTDKAVIVHVIGPRKLITE